MNTFLHAVAKNLLARYGDQISSLSLVFPSRRAQLFFAESLASLVTQPLWEPTYSSFDQIAQRFSLLKKADDFSLLIKLYRIYCKHTKSTESFDHFYCWGETLLSDFDDVDKYLVDPRLLFKNLSNLKELEGDFSFLSNEQIDYIQTFWHSFDPQKTGGLQAEFIEIWDVLLPIYQDFKQQLQAAGEGYAGMIYRDMVETIRRRTVDESTISTYVFIGFNALGECEKSLFSYLKSIDRADFYWDYDDYYVDDKSQEAGMFLRDNLKDFPAPASFNMVSEFTQEKDIRLLAAPSDILQAKFIPQLLEQLQAPGDKRTAIVLADENLLIPLLHALPPEIEEINVTLGYPLAQTPVFTLVELLIAVQRSFKTSNLHVGFYHKDVLSVLQHQYIRMLVGELGLRIEEDILVNNRVYIEQTIFAPDPFLQYVFTPLSGYKDIIQYLLTIFARIAQAPPVAATDDRALRCDYIFALTKVLNRLKTSMDAEDLEIGIPVFLSLLRGVFRTLRIPFAGEPVRGLQVMGLLETRTLDFENVLLLSANEGVLPPAATLPSFIPYHLRLGFKLPTAEQKEAVSAYLFYRLLQRSERVGLLYSTKSDPMRTGEMSRYLYQLKFESKHAIREHAITYQVNFAAGEAISVRKNESVMSALRHYLGTDAVRSLSPSAFSTYITCPLQFYFAKVARIEPSEEVQEEVAANVLGTILHNTMEQLYTPYLNKPMSQQAISSILEDKLRIDVLIDSNFAKEFYKKDHLPDDFNENGKLLLTRDVIRKYVHGVLKFDASRAGFIPLGFEKEYKLVHPFDLKGETLLVNFGGIIDRVDRMDGGIRIIDYKTGGGLGKDRRMKFKGVESLFLSDAEQRNKEAFQTFLYALFYYRAYPQEALVTPALYFVRDSYLDSFDYHLLDTGSSPSHTVFDYSQYVDSFVELLDQTLSNLFDPEIPFTQTTCAKACSFCPYAQLCGK